MTFFIIAQIVGLAGYLLLVAAPGFKTRTRILTVECGSCFVLFLHWLLLGNMLYAVSNLARLYIVGAGLAKGKSKYANAFLFGAYFIVGLIAYCFWENTLMNYTVLMAGFMTVTSKFHTDLVKFRAYSLVAGLFSVCNAVLSYSLYPPLFLMCYSPAIINYCIFIRFL